MVAVRVNVYAVPLDKLETVQDVEAVVQVKEPGVEVTVYEEIAEPLAKGAIQDKETDALLATPVGAAGVAGGPRGMKDADAADAADEPRAFDAETVKV